MAAASPGGLGSGLKARIVSGVVLLAVVVALLSMRQHRRVLRALGSGQAAGYDFRLGLWLNALVGLLGLGLSAYLVVGYV